MPHGVLAGGDVFDWADLPERLADQFGVRVTQQILEEWVDVRYPSCVGIQEEYAVLGRLEESPVANFGSLQGVLDPLALVPITLRPRLFAGGLVGPLGFQFGQARLKGGILLYKLGFRLGWH